jgi:hypothetical protein
MAFLQVLREKELAGRKQTDGIENLTASDPCKTSNAIQSKSSARSSFQPWWNLWGFEILGLP